MTITLEWLSVSTGEADLSPPASEKNDNNTPTRPVRVPADLWRDFGYACEDMKTDRSAYLRDVMRWAIHEPGVKMPKRPAAAPVMPRPEPMPAAIKAIEETLASGAVVTRFLVHVNADPEAVVNALKDAKAAKGLMYMLEDPVPVTTYSRDQALRMYRILSEAGLDIVGDKP